MSCNRIRVRLDTLPSAGNAQYYKTSVCNRISTKEQKKKNIIPRSDKSRLSYYLDTNSRDCIVSIDKRRDHLPSRRARAGEGMVLGRGRGCRRCGRGRDRRPRGRHVDGRLKLLAVLLLLLLLRLLLVIRAGAVPATSAPVKHPPRELTPRHLVGQRKERAAVTRAFTTRRSCHPAWCDEDGRGSRGSP